MGKADEIYIYGAIVDEKWDETDPEVTPIEFQLKLQAVINKDVKIFINSPGGNVFCWFGYLPHAKKTSSKQNLLC